jgi:hypothetical protein
MFYIFNIILLLLMNILQINLCEFGIIIIIITNFETLPRQIGMYETTLPFAYMYYRNSYICQLVVIPK